MSSRTITGNGRAPTASPAPSALPFAIVVQDLRGEICAWAGGAEALLGWSEAEVLGRRCPLLERETTAAMQELVESVRAGASVRGRTWNTSRRDGTPLALDVTMVPVRGHDGAVTATLSVLVETSAHARMRAALVASEEKYRSFIEHAPDGVLLVDGQGRIIESNPAVRAMLGYTEEELSRLFIWDTIGAGAAGLEVARQHFGALLEAGKAMGEVPQRRKDGSNFVADINAVALGGDRYLGFLRDVSRQQHLEAQSRLYTQAFQNAGEAILITDAQNHIVSVNEAFTQITGYAAHEVVGKNPRLLSSGRHDRPFYEALWRSLEETGRWQGELWNRRKNGEVFPEWATINAVRSRGRVVNYIAVFSDVGPRLAAEARVTYLAQHDALTGLDNRAVMEDRLAQAVAAARQQGGQVALLFIDLDQFKHINDSLGHQVGDLYLKVAAGRLRRCVRASDTVARLGGDEFALVLPAVRTEQDVVQVAGKVLAAMSEPLAIEGHEVLATASIGVALYPKDGADGATLARSADTAMYSAKERGRNAYQFFRHEMSARVSERVDLESRLRHAVERGQLALHYQPQIELSTGRLVGAEALLRWTDGELGAVAPARFIPIAEESGLIIPVGDWVLREAFSRVRRWADEGLPRFSVAVNISAVQFRQQDFVDSVRRALVDSGADATRIELEVTEGVVMQDPVGAARALEALRELGLHLAIDDFGTGYSSLSYLKRFPIDRLKVDHSFVRDLTTDLNDMEIVRAVVALGHALGLEVLAEGVETPEQVMHLLRHGCDQAQGWYYAKAVAPQQLEALVRAPPATWRTPAK